MARRSLVIDMELKFRQARKALQNLEGDFGRLSQKTNQTATQTRKATSAMGQGFNRTSTQVRGSMNSVQNLTRIVEDAPFGVRGVANNINPFIESFQRLKSQTGSTTNALKTLLTSAFTGPGALLTISALVTSAITAIQMGIIDLGDESDKTESELKGLLDAVKELDGVIDRDAGLAGNVEREIAANERAIELVKQRQELKQRQGQALQQNEFDQFGALQDRIDSLDRLITLQGFENKELRELEKNLAQLKEAQRLYNQEVGTSEQKMAAFVDGLEADAQQTINKYEAGVKGGEQAIKDKIVSLETMIETYRGAANAGRDDLIPVITILQDVMDDLEGTLEESDGMEGYKKSAEEAAKALENVRYELMQQAQQRAQGGIIQGPNTQFSDMGVGLPDMPEGGVEMGPAMGSISELRSKLSEYENELANTPIGTEKFNELAEAIKRVKNELNNAEEATENTGDAAQESGKRASDSFKDVAEHTLSAASAQLMMADSAEEAANRIVDTIIAEIVAYAIKSAIRDIPFPANIAAATGAAAAGKGLSELIPSFRTGVDDFEGGIARVHKDELITNLPAGSNVITNENVERMSRMQQQAKNTATNINNVGLRDELKGAIRESMGRMGLQVNISTRDVVESIVEVKEFENRIGNDIGL